MAFGKMRRGVGRSRDTEQFGLATMLLGGTQRANAPERYQRMERFFSYYHHPLKIK